MELFLRIVQLVVRLIYMIVYPLLQICLPRNRNHVLPPIKNKLLLLSLGQVQERLRTQQIKSKELVQAYIDRIREVDPYINAVIEERFSAALTEAQRYDRMIKACGTDSKKEVLFKRMPLIGIPYTVKESCGVRGMSHVVGSLARSGMRAKNQCEPVTKLNEAGAILLLVSANPEYCFSIETNTFTNGRCLNPFDLRRTCGGSSGGEGALNGSAASLFGIGSDIAGSIRIPSLFNGVFGHKPTGGLISNKGHFPDSDDPNCLEYLQMGPITRFGTDLFTILKVIAGSNAEKLDLETVVPTHKIRIFYSLGFEGFNGLFHQSVSYDIKESISRAVEYLRYIGATIQRANIKNLRNSTEIALTGIGRLRNFPYLMRADLKQPTVKENIWELLKSFIGLSKYSKEALIFELMRSTNVFMGEENMVKYKEATRHLKQEIIDLLGSDGVLILPTFHVPAIHHNTSIFPLWGVDYCLIFNVLGLPCTHIPMGLDEKGLPVGFQVVAGPMRDKLCLQIASEFHLAFEGWKPLKEWK